jgi:excisionase family DNA binding protein
MNKTIFTTHDVASICQVSINTVVNWIKNGSLKAYKTKGGHRRILKEDFDHFLVSNQMPLNLKNKILIIDDEKTICEGLQEFFIDNGFEAATAENGFYGGMLLEKMRPSVVILDIFMPGLDGFWICECIRNHEYLFNTKIIILTGYPSPENIKRAKEAGANRVVTKPVDNHMLLKTTQELLGLYQESPRSFS